MGYNNCEHTRPVDRGPQLTNNGYWCKDNKADGRILTMSRQVNREGLMQCTVRHGEGQMPSVTVSIESNELTK